MAKQTQDSLDAPTDPRQGPTMTAAQDSLSDALRVCFFFLKLIMVFLVVAYLLSGLFTIKEQEVAVRLQLGRIVGEPGEQIVRSGGVHFAWPYPLGEVIKVPTTVQKLDIDKAFMFEVLNTQRGLTLEELSRMNTSGLLNPERDSYVVTADANIVHGQWQVNYVISDPLAYVRSVGESLDDATQLVQLAAQRSIVSFASGRTADRMLRLKAADNVAIRRLMQKNLDQMGLGLTVTNVTTTNAIVPSQVRDAFQQVNKADSERETRINQAQQEATQILKGAAGDAYEPLWEMIQAYELALADQDMDKVNALDAKLREALTKVAGSPTATGSFEVGGRAANIINEAQTYSTQVVQTLLGQVEQYKALLDSYRQAPDVTVARLWQDALTEFMTGDIEVFYANPGSQLWLELSRDPKIKQERDRRMWEERRTTPQIKSRDQLEEEEEQRTRERENRK